MKTEQEIRKRIAELDPAKGPDYEEAISKEGAVEALKWVLDEE